MSQSVTTDISQDCQDRNVWEIDCWEIVQLELARKNRCCNGHDDDDDRQAELCGNFKYYVYTNKFLNNLKTGYFATPH